MPKTARAVFVATAMLITMVSASSVDAASATTPETFTHRIARAKLVVLANVRQGRYTVVLDVERVLKGRAGARLVFPNGAGSPLETGWRRVVLAMDQPNTFDYRGGATAWHVSPTGQIDAEGFQPFPGRPATVQAMLAYFHVAAPDTSTISAPAPPTDVPLWFDLVVGALAAGAAAYVATRRPVTRSRQAADLRGSAAA